MDELAKRSIRKATESIIPDNEPYKVQNERIRLGHDLVRAAKAGKSREARVAIKTGADPLVTIDRFSAVYWAAVANKPAICNMVAKQIIKNIARIPKWQLNNLLAEAAVAGNAGLCRALVKRGANVNTKTGEAALGMTPLIAATKHRHFEACAALINSGAEINALDRLHYTALMVAARASKHPGMIKFLISKGADPNFQNPQGITAFMVAASQNTEVNCMALLESGANPVLRDGLGRTAWSMTKSPIIKRMVEEFAVSLIFKTDEEALAFIEPFNDCLAQ
jgi:ankyrin repeat protein